jgi:hypothetical protein
MLCLYNDATDIRSFESLSSKCTLPGFTSSTPSSRGTKSTTATGSETTRAALKGLRRAEAVGARPERSRALAGPEKPGARKPRLLYPVRTRSLAL